MKELFPIYSLATPASLSIWRAEHKADKKTNVGVLIYKCAFFSWLIWTNQKWTKKERIQHATWILNDLFDPEKRTRMAHSKRIVAKVAMEMSFPETTKQKISLSSLAAMRCPKACCVQHSLYKKKLCVVWWAKDKVKCLNSSHWFCICVGATAEVLG